VPVRASCAVGDDKQNRITPGSSVEEQQERYLYGLVRYQLGRNPEDPFDSGIECDGHRHAGHE